MNTPTAPTNLAGAMDLIKKSRFSLKPLQEAIINSLEAIAQRGPPASEGNTIGISVYFSGFYESAKTFEWLKIVDNGLGFNDENFSRFKTLLDKIKGFKKPWLRAHSIPPSI